MVAPLWTSKGGKIQISAVTKAVDCSLENGILMMPSRRDLDDGKKILQPE